MFPPPLDVSRSALTFEVVSSLARGPRKGGPKAARAKHTCSMSLNSSTALPVVAIFATSKCNTGL